MTVPYHTVIGIEIESNNMSIEDYKAALKLGEREASSLSAKKESPYLVVLDDIPKKIVKRENLGIQTIPAELIAGTVHNNRSNAFSRSFYPLLSAGSEFASKWALLYDSISVNGMREGIICEEYMGKYYVIEGNKRVSVNRFLGVPFIEGTVTRLVPEKTDDPEIKLYYEYLEFYKKSGIAEIHFTKLGSFDKFAKLVAPGEEVWSEDTVINVRSLYNRFRKAYDEKRGEDKLRLPASDAMLVYVSLLGTEDTKDKTATEMTADITKMWDEFILDTKEEPIAVSTHPVKDKSNVITTLFKGKSRLKIAFMHQHDTTTSTRVYAHELGRHYLEEKAFPQSVTTESFYNVSTEDAEDKLEELCKAGFDMIFSTSPEHNAACAKIAILYPQTKILNCSLNTSTAHMRTYYIRSYESKFLLGLIAGAMTKTNHISYIADYPVYGTIASINAFAIGAKTVNPCCEIFLPWTSAKDSDPDKDITDNNCDIVSSIDISSPKQLTRKYGLYLNLDGYPIQLAAPLTDWGKLYEQIIKTVLNGTWEDAETELGAEDRSLSYWWGLSGGCADIIYSEKKIPPRTLDLVNFLKEQMIKGQYHPISGTLRFQDGTEQDFEDNFDILNLINMDKLYENIHGYIPGVSEIKQEAVELAKAQGIKADDTASD